MQDPQRASAKTPDADSPTERYARLVIASAFAVGVAFRVFQYAAGRSLWLDEVALASALLQRPVSGAVLPGPWGAVPPGFLVLVKLCSLALGSGELALRLVPLLGGVVSLALFIYVVRRYLPPAAGAFAMVLFAAASYPIYYASELKQYSTDAAVCVGLLLWAITLRDGPFTARRATILALVGFGCVVLSLTSVFVLGGIVLSLLLSAWREGRKAELRRLLAVGVCWAVVIGVPGLLFLHRITGSGGYALSFWRAGFMPMPPRSLREAAWLPLALLKLFQEPLGVLEFSDSWVNYMQIAAGALAALLGTVWLWRRRPVLAGFLTFPIALALVDGPPPNG